MPTEDASLRQDVIENAVQHEVVPIDEAASTKHSLTASFAAQLEHDLTIWPREYLETYLDSDDQGNIPVNEARLQDLLEAAFDRNEQLIHSSRHGLNSETQFRESMPPSSNNGSSPRAPISLAKAAAQEPYVDAQRVAEHLSLSRREVLKLTRARKLPAHAIDPSAARKIYRYKLSEIDDMLLQTLTAEEALGFTIPSRHNDHRQPLDRRG